MQFVMEFYIQLFCLIFQDLEDMDDEAQKLQLENNALIRAVSQLSTQV